SRRPPTSSSTRWSTWCTPPSIPASGTTDVSRASEIATVEPLTDAGPRVAEIAGPVVPATRRRWVRRLLRNKNVVLGATIFLLLLGAAILAPWISTHVPTRLDPVNRLKPPSTRHFLGTDEFGRDVYSLVVYGSRVSLMVGEVTMVLTSAGGIIIGL